MPWCLVECTQGSEWGEKYVDHVLDSIRKKASCETGSSLREANRSVPSLGISDGFVERIDASKRHGASFFPEHRAHVENWSDYKNMASIDKSWSNTGDTVRRRIIGWKTKATSISIENNVKAILRVSVGVRRFRLK